jgi:hypothetical protein
LGEKLERDEETDASGKQCFHERVFFKENESTEIFLSIILEK